MKVEFRDVSYKKRKFCLHNLSFEIREGFITALVGKNGAGKTTIFHLLLDEKAHYTGTILADGADWKQSRTELMNRVGFVSDEQEFFMEHTALDNAKALQCLYDEFSLDHFQGCMEQMNLSVYKTLRSMSRGEYIKYQLAFAMAHKSALYLLDEAAAGMDLVFKKEFFQMLHKLMLDEKCAVLISTHIQEDIQKHMDYIVRIEDGGMVTEYEAGRGRI